jgi:uncharacterized protein (TIGR02453 family)
MLQNNTLQFLKNLQKNNNRPWFEANRKLYEAAKEDMAKFSQQIIDAIAVFDAPIGQLLPKDCMFRINRDVRFSKNKDPYKTNMGASFNAGGKKVNNAGYYFHCEPGQCFAAGGFYMPMPPDLNKIRQEIDYNFNEWQAVIGSKNFKKYFPMGVDGISSLVRPPKGYDENNAAIHYLKMKGFIVSRPLADDAVTNKSVVKEVVKTFEAMKPMIDFLNTAIK